MLKYQGIKYEINCKVTDTTLLEYAKAHIIKKFKLQSCDISNIFLLKKSIDARKKAMYILTVGFSCKRDLESKLLKKYEKDGGLKPHLPRHLEIPRIQENRHYLVVGMGPAGLFNALILAKSGAKVTLIDRGKKVEERLKDVECFFQTGVLNKESNVQFGEGGAGTFSDGKLNTGNTTTFTNEVLKIFVEFGANPNILYEAKPHIGTDELRKIIKNIREELGRLGVELLFETKLIEMKEENYNISTILENKDKMEKQYHGVVLAIGHSAEDTYQMLCNIGVNLRPKAFAIGVRMEHPQSLIDALLYHDASKFLPPASYKLVTHLSNGRAAYSFCMCPGGFVVNASSDDQHLVVNGMSNSRRDGKNANAAILVEIKPEDYYQNSPLDGLKFQRELENKAYALANNFYAPCQMYKDFKKNISTIQFGSVKPTIQPGYIGCNLYDILPTWLCDNIQEAILHFDKKMNHFAYDDAVLTAVETRSSSPVQITRDETYQTNIKKIYPIGEGSGYSGGIITSAVDGIKCALKIIEEVNNGKS